jgi:predicted anti-sigma-YlaC factor YlaD
MKNVHVIKSYQAWDDGRVTPEERRTIQQHLEECAECRRYYENMSLLLEKPDPSLLPRLEPDPFLPTRIRAEVEGKKTRHARRRAAGWARLSAAGAMVVVAATLGVYLGTGLSTGTQSVDDTEMINAYYQAFSPTSIVDDWASLLENGEDEG